MVSGIRFALRERTEKEKTKLTVTFWNFANAPKNNNNNIYLLQLGCHPVAVVILHVITDIASKFY